MKAPTSKVTGWLTEYTSGLRFPVLLAVTAVLFAVNLFVLDPIPLVDEILLGLVTVILARLKKRKPGPGRGEGPVERDRVG